MGDHPRGSTVLQPRATQQNAIFRSNVFLSLHLSDDTFLFSSLIKTVENLENLWSCAMESNRSSKGCSIFQLILFALLLNFWAVQAAYVKFANDPAQRKLCQVKKSENVCKQDDKCAWNDIQWLCNEFGYQPDLQHCNEAACPGQDCLWSSLVHCAFKAVRTIIHFHLFMLHNLNINTHHSRMYISPRRSGRRMVRF